MATKSGRTIIATKPRSIKTALFRWETFLIFIFILVNVMNIGLSSKYLHTERLFTTINTFLVKGFIALPMAYILVLGEIDLSVGSTVALSAVMLGVTYNAGLPMGAAVVVCLLCGLVCGMINGLILTRFTELAPMIVTLGTMTLYRGIGEMILGNESTGGLQNVKWFYDLYYARIGPVPYMFILFVVMAVAFGLVLHKTSFGRKVYAIGSNRLAAAYSGIKVQKIRFIVYSLVGIVCGISAVFYASWMGTVRSDVATGYELEAISMVVLGGISTIGGKGNYPGTVISIFIIGLLKYGLGLINVTSQAMLVIVGAILIIVVMAPSFNIGRLFKKRDKKKAVQ